MSGLSLSLEQSMLYHGAATSFRSLKSGYGQGISLRRLSLLCTPQFSLSPSKKATGKSKSTRSEDPFDHYRVDPLPPELRDLVKLETLHSWRKINRELFQRVLDEIQVATDIVPLATPEQGPTGAWWYQFHVDQGSDTRRYQRFYINSQANETERVKETGNKRMAMQTVAELHPNQEVLSASLSVDESYFACLIEDITGAFKEVKLRNMDTGREITFESTEDLVGLEWGPMPVEGDLSLYMLKCDKLGRPERVFVCSVHPTSLHVGEPKLLFHSDNPAEIVDIKRTKGCAYVSIQAITKTSNEIFLSSGPDSLKLVLPRQANLQYYLDVGEEGDLILLLSYDGSEYCIFETRVSELPLRPQTMEKFFNKSISSDKQRYITDIDLFRKALVLYENEAGTGAPWITIRQRRLPDESHDVSIALSKEGTSMKISPLGNSHFSATSLFFRLETPVAPPRTRAVDLTTGKISDFSSVESWPKSCQEEKIWVSSSDGTAIPMSLYYYADSEKGSRSFNVMHRPVLLISYGAYGEPVNMAYDPSLIPLIERGHIIAFAHTRGGGELGRSWYYSGRQEHKGRAIEDLEACGAYLRKRFGGPLSAKGFSAAGVLIGAAMSRHPKLFDSIILTNAFLDVYATLTNEELYLTAHEWEEYGNPLADPQINDLISSYCPVHSFAASRKTSSAIDLPKCLLIGALDDTEVPVSNTLIFAKLLQEIHVNPEHIWLHVEESGGHELTSQRTLIQALEVSFLLQHAGIGSGIAPNGRSGRDLVD